MKKLKFLQTVFVVTLSLPFMTACSDSDDLNEQMVAPDTETTTFQFSFEMANNPYTLQSDVQGTIHPDNTIFCHIPNLVETKVLVPTFNDKDFDVFINDQPIISGVTEINFTNPVSLKVSNQNKELQEFTVYTSSFTGLPTVFITTENRAAITSREVYINAHIKIIPNTHVRATSNALNTEVAIRLRGNTTSTMPKKPYKLKFNTPTSILGLPAEKKWVLLANYSDKTSLRNELAFHLGRMSKLDYTCKTEFVDLFLNEEYMGIYQLGEQQEVSPNRVTHSKNGILLEVDNRATSADVTFQLGTVPNPICIKDPSMDPSSTEFKDLVDFFQKAEQSLFGKEYLNENNGYAQYFDIPSFADWYLINEMAKNNDACFFSSCYMNYQPGGKIKMGPIWDFDIAFANINYNGNQSPEGFWIKPVVWFNRLFTDPKFVKVVKERFNYYYSQKSEIYKQINNDANMLRYAVIENNNKWKTLYQYTWPNFAIWGSYENEIQNMKMWLDKRMEWLKGQFDQM